MKISEAFPSNYLKADELNGDTTYTISEVKMETLGSGKDAEQKPVIYFEEIDTGLACNKTNAGTIAGLYGDDTDGWAGKRITLFATEVDFQGKQVLAIRVRMRAPANGTAPAPARPAATGPSPAKAAWDSFRAHNPGKTTDELAAEWKALVSETYPGRTKEQIHKDEWAALKTKIEAGLATVDSTLDIPDF